MMKTAYKILLASLLLCYSLLGQNLVAQAEQLQNCAGCHDFLAKPNVDPAKFDLPTIGDGSPQGSVVDKAKCTTCHMVNFNDSHAQQLPVTLISVQGVAYGSFKSPDSIYKLPQEIHAAHNSVSAVSGSSCKKCHAKVACSACHTRVEHKDHYTGTNVNPKTGQPIITPTMEVVNGQFNPAVGSSIWTESVSCATAECHKGYPAPVRYNNVNNTNQELCYNCHDNGSSGHSEISLQGAHSTNFTGVLTFTDQLSGNYAVDCSGCHNQSLSAEHSNQNRDCMACHKSTNPGVQLVVKTAAGIPSEKACEKCHFNSAVLAPPSGLLRTEHKLFHIATDSNYLRVDGAPHNDCNTCHARPTPLAVQAKVNGVPQTMAIAELAGQPSKKYSCLACHNGGTNPKAPRHVSDLNGQAMSLVDVHNDCSICHTAGTPAANTVGALAARLNADPNATYSCEECHTDLSAGHKATFGTLQIEDTTSFHANCSTCHNPAFKGTVATLKDLVKLGQQYDCNACHLMGNVKGNSPYYPQHTAGNDNIVSFHPNSCNSCHGISNGLYKINLDGLRAKVGTTGYKCADCHSGSIAQVPFHLAKDAQGAQYVTTDLHTTCATCHNSPIESVRNVINAQRGTTTAYDCNACHSGSQAPKHSAKWADGTTYETTQFHQDCAQCHASDKIQVGEKIHSLKLDLGSGSVTEYSCDACHGTLVPGAKHSSKLVATDKVAQESVVYHAKLATDSKDVCFVCHNNQNVAADMDKIVSQVASTGNYLCVDCHKNSNQAPYRPVHLASIGNVQYNAVNEHTACTTCHTTAADTKISALKGNSGYSCEACHGDLVAKHQSTTNLASRSNMINCAWCHSSDEAAYAVNNLIGVHTKPNVTLTQTMTCKVCHNDNSKVREQIASSRTGCADCHDGIAAPLKHPDSQFMSKHVVTTMPSFLPEYKPNCITCHTNKSVIGLHAPASVGCTTCHFTEDYKAAVTSLTLDCANCHKAEVKTTMDMVYSHEVYHNANVSAYPATAECLKCHGVDNTANGQTLLAVHKKNANSTVTCDSCHATNARAAVKTAVATNNISCQACHTGSGHNHPVSATGYTPQGKVDCAGCHNTNTATQTADLATVHQQAADRGLIANYSCNTCHNANFEGAGKVISKDGTLDMKINGSTVIYCINCHNGTLADALDKKYPAHAGNHVNATGYGTYKGTYNGATFDDSGVDCSKCHNSLETKVIHDPAVHPNVDCNSCHQSSNAAVQSVIAGAWSRATTKTPYTCASCHNTLPYQHKKDHMAQAKENVTCNQCHNGTTVKGLFNAPVGSPVNVSNSAVHNECNKCHATPNTTVQNFITANLRMENSVYNCESCHDGITPQHNKMHTVTSYLSGSNSDCSGCHSNDITITHQNVASACDACHGSSPKLANTKNVITANLSSNPGRTGFTCQSCHTNAGGHNHPVAAKGFAATANVSCGKCHATETDGTGELVKIHQAAADSGKIIGFGCATCHNSTFEGTGKVISKDGNIDLKINGTTPIYCASCHNGTSAHALGTKYPAHNGTHINATDYGTYKGSYNGVAFDDSNVNCSKCHASLETKVVHDSTIHTNVNCDSCHMSSNSEVQKVINGAWSRSATKTAYTCASCHNTLPYLHQPEHVANTADAGVDCASCHNSSAWANGNAQLVTVHKGNCNLCHNNSSAVVTNFINNNKGKANAVYSCEGCHTTGGAQTKEAVHQPEHQAQHSAVNMTCSSCHSFSVAAGTPTNISAASIHKDCSTCHGASAPQTVKDFIASLKGKANTTYTCENCHGSIHQGWDAKHKPSFSGLSMNCATCHDNYLPNEHQKAIKTTPEINTNIGYKVLRSTTSTGPWTEVGKTTAAQWVDTALAANTSYYYKVGAYDGKPNYSPDSSVISVRTLTSAGSVSTINPDSARYASGNGDSGNDPSSTTDVKTSLTDNSNSTYQSIKESGTSDQYVFIQVNQDAAQYSKVELKLSVRYYNSTNLVIYPYTSTSSINSNAEVSGPSRSSSSSYVTETIDVTNAAKTMSNNGWIKFRIKPDSSKSATVYLANAQLVLTSTPTSGGSYTNPSGAVPSNSSDITAPSVPAGLTGVSNYYDRIDLTWTPSTDVGSSPVASDTCSVCHGPAANNQVKNAISSKNANCNACHTIHGDIATAHTGNALATTPWDCKGCHTNVLSVEHSSGAKLAGNAKMNCDTCHNSSLAKVKAAIASAATDKSNLGCIACHTGTADGAPAMHSSMSAPHLNSIFPTATDTTCLNCHTKQSAEFSEMKASYHMVGNLSSKASGKGSYISPWNSNMTVGCKGCHGDLSDGKAQASKILKRPYTYKSNSSQTDMLCYLCHNRNSYGGSSGSSGFSSGSSNLHNIGDHKEGGGLQCSWCHIAVPHGSSQAHLITTKSDVAPYNNGNLLTSYTHASSGSYSERSCGSNVSACDEH